jgi:outer membrane protein assembly factor BamC
MSSVRTVPSVSSLRRSLPLLAAALAGCSSFGNFMSGDKTAYQSESRQTSGLEVPPDLSQLAREGRYQAPAAVVSANQTATAPARPTTVNTSTMALDAAGDATLKRDGELRWLAVGRPPEQLWQPVRTFWIDSGFTLALEDPQIGVMETDWAENRAKLPKDTFRATVGRLIENLYDSGERDRFRTRIERTPTGSEIYITHKGLTEQYTDKVQQDQTRWMVRPEDTQLEAEFLSRLMVRLGSSDEAARVALASATAPAAAAAHARLVPGQPTATVEIDDDFERAWRRVGLALDRTGFTVEDRNRADGLYYVRYVPSQAAEQGFFSRLFSSGDEAGKAERYRIAVKSTGGKSLVSVQTADGQPVPDAVGQRIAGVLLNDLK